MEQKLIEKITEIGEKKGWNVDFSENDKTHVAVTRQQAMIST